MMRMLALTLDDYDLLIHAALSLQAIRADELRARPDAPQRVQGNWGWQGMVKTSRRLVEKSPAATRRNH